MVKILSLAALSLLLSVTGATQEGSRTLNPGQQVFKVYNNPEKDLADQFEIQGLGSTSFTVSNTADGTANSYKHAVQVILALVPVNRSAGSNFQLYFYAAGENIQQAATYKDGTLNIYYPVALYEDIRTRLEQALAAKKKVTVKVVQKTNGYREGTLVL